MRSWYPNSQLLFAMFKNFAKKLSKKYHVCCHAAFICFLSNTTKTSINEEQTLS